MKKILIFIPLFLLFTMCEKKAIKVHFSGSAQGTYYSITYFDEQGRNFQQETDSLLKDFDRSVSLWVENSIISRINRNEKEVVVDKHFSEIFTIAKKIARETEGAFDFSVGPLIRAYGFYAEKAPEINEQLIDSLLPLVDYHKVRLENGYIMKENPDMLIDFNAIAQGYSVDLIADFLESKGIENYLVDVGGEVYAEGVKANGENWIVGIEKPAEDKLSGRQIQEKVRLQDKALATSGSYRKYYEKDGIRYSHTIDPKTGRPVEHSLLSVSVLAENAALADGYATAFMVMGLKKSQDFLDKHPELGGYFIYSDYGGKMKTWSSEGLSDIAID